MKIFITESNYTHYQPEIREIKTLKHLHDLIIEKGDDLIIKKRSNPNELNIEVYNNYRE